MKSAPVGKSWVHRGFDQLSKSKIGIGYIGCMISFFSIYLPIVYIHIYIPQIFTELMPQISEVVMATAGLFLELAKGAHCDIAKLPGSQLVEWSTTVYIFFK